MSPFIAEPANTFSNLSFVLLGLFGAFHEFRQVSIQKSRMSYVLLHAGVVAIGLGSMLFHGKYSFYIHNFMFHFIAIFLKCT